MALDDDSAYSWFYGPPGSRPKRRLKNSSDSELQLGASFSREFESKRTKLSLFEESLGCFNVFWRQREALAKKREEGPYARVFSFEHSLSNAGQRRFLVSTVERFWRWYEGREDAAFYELIPDCCPARLFFDLEFYRESNSDANENELIAGFNECVSETFKEFLHIDIDPDKNMLVLDSSTPAKYSEHVIVHLPTSQLFPSVVSMKPFVEVLRKKMLNSGRGVVLNADGNKRTTICDTNVYTMNRNFRLYLSSKLGKHNPLKLSSRCRFYSSKGRKPSPKQVFFDSLVVPPYLSDENALVNIGNSTRQYDDIYDRKLNILRLPVQQPTVRDNFVVCMTGHGSTSPFPMLDHHIISINKRWKESTSIRVWKLSKDVSGGRRRITYYLAGCRYCFNIGREHRSNGVFWTVDLERLYCYQKCFDVDCRGTSSNFFPLPYFVCASIPSFEEVAEAQAPEDAFGDQSTASLVDELKNTTEVEINGEVECKLKKLRRRSAANEKLGAIEPADSFYDEAEDEELNDFLDRFESDQMKNP